jgi:predicted GNAT superfamily acetyltransferase
VTRTSDLPLTGSERDPVVERAIEVAQAAARRCGVEVREIDRLPELEDVSVLLSIVWNRAASGRTIATDLLVALSKTGNYVAGAYLDGRLIGAAVAFFSLPRLNTMHSHITGVVGPDATPGAGYALKLHQRAWALAHGVTTVTWTFDPLLRRNAHFNINKLGVRAAEYLPNFYGAMKDNVNTGDSDRLLVAWELRSPAAVAAGERGGAAEPDDDPVATILHVAADGGPRRERWDDGVRAVLEVPPDVERMRVEAPQLAQEWRLALRETLGAAMAGGGRVVAFRQREGYVVETGAASR